MRVASLASTSTHSPNLEAASTTVSHATRGNTRRFLELLAVTTAFPALRASMLTRQGLRRAIAAPRASTQPLEPRDAQIVK